MGIFLFSYSFLCFMIIELVCTANMGRSIVAELIANNYLKDSSVIAQSSGTLVNVKRSGNLPYEMMKGLIDLGVSRGLYQHGDAEDLILYQRAEHFFEAEEKRFRAKAFKELGIEGELKKIPEQTVERDITAVLSIGDANNQRVKGIYRKYNPIIEELYAYAGISPGESAFGKDYTAYLEMLVKLRETVHVAVDRVVREL